MESGEYVLLASAARTATISTADQTNRNGQAVQVVINATAETATASVVPTIEGKDPISGTYYVLLTGAAVDAVGIVALTVGLGVTSVTNVAIGTVLPKTWRVTMTAADADSLTYSISATLVG